MAEEVEAAGVEPRVMVCETVKQALAGQAESRDPVDPELVCAVCFGPAFGGVLSACCGHVFHAVCVHTLSDCPTCREKLDCVSMPRPLRVMLENKRVECACGELVAFGNLKDHVRSNCSASRLRCSHCHETLPRDGLADHLAQCPSLPVQCACGYRGARSDVEGEHKGECGLVNVGCRYCGEERPRGVMQGHLDTECAGKVPVREHRRLLRLLEVLSSRLARVERAADLCEPCRRTRVECPCCPRKPPPLGPSAVHAYRRHEWSAGPSSPLSSSTHSPRSPAPGWPSRWLWDTDAGTPSGTI
eukprot:Hpha_TRINITY_DN34481_c0_g1::TRINITY_DN34481_c0_g1_i1::g.96199::m.96199